VDGKGWIPVSMTSLSFGSPLGAWPQDPVNQTSSGLFYTYQTNGTQYEVTALLESQKYKAQLASSPQIPNYPEVAAQGSNLTLSQLWNPSGLVGYWPLDEGTGSTTQDLSGNNKTGTFTSGVWSAGKIGGALLCSSTIVSTADLGVPVNGPGTFSAWINMTISAVAKGSTNQIFSNFYQHAANNYFYNTHGADYFPPLIPAINSWHYIVFTWNGNTATSIMYYDGVKYPVVVQMSGNVDALGSVNICGVGGSFFSGLIDDVRIYNRTLNAAEVMALYNAQK
jgi:hypothetical protein